mgnify:CR=1 FL=1|jgi:hypothetical protein
MDDKKKKVTEEETKGLTPGKEDEIMDFDEVRGDDAGKAGEKTDKNMEGKESPEEAKAVSATGKKEKEEQKDSDKEADKKEEKKASDKEVDKKEEKKASDKETEKKEENEKASDKEADKKEENKKASDKEVDKKEEKKDSDKEDDKKDKEKAGEKVTASKEEDIKNNAVSQSKRIADAKASQKTIENAEGKDTAASDKEQKNSSRKPKSKKALWITLGTAAVLLVIAYISGFVYFLGHFYQDAAINGINISGMNKADAKRTLDNFYANYMLTMETIDGKQVVIDGKEISMQVSLHDEFGSCIQKQKPYIWFVNMWKHHDYEIGADASWDETALADLYDSMDILKKKLMTAPKDAYVGIEDGKFAIVKEIMGTTIKVSDFKNAVEESLSRVQSNLDLVEAGCYELPEVYDTDEALKKELDAKNVFAENEIKLQMDDLTLEPGMELYDEVLEKSGDSYKVSKKLVEKYVKNLAEEYDTLGKERTFTTSFSDRKVEVLGTAFGYELNQEETTDALYKALTSGKAETVEAVFNSKGYTLQGENDIGDTYIEVNLSEQHVVAYKDGKKLTEGDCVSGSEAAGHGTCIGLYAIQGKQSPTVLRGEKKPVTKTVTKKKKGKKVKVTETTMEYEYESPVTFWMPFNGGIGLHDAAGWRSQYGGSIYYYSGSHGCVNLPYDLAETLYNNFEVGDPVIVYFWDNENRK